MHRLAVQGLPPGDISGVEFEREEDFYTTLDGGHDAMLGWGPNYECNMYWEDCPLQYNWLSLVVLGQIRTVVVTCSRRTPVLGGPSRQSWQQRSVSVLINWCRIKRRPT
ncbi:hypothetical protein DEO72_LG11g1510 [Vigna unguiculata]|uniref:Uncharacterized protein n=1 Tax=Vigna unguiculata TaxID=3917 RepID=A0A4D6NPP7_VIGUN|nr:hypothetical protein DEO72_LG11g1510 [Vigna unguiculata]